MKKLVCYGVYVFVVLIASMTQQSKVPEKAWTATKSRGVVRVIVTLTVEEIPEGKLTREARDFQRQAIAAGQDALIAELKGTKYRVIGKGRTGNFIGLEVGEDALSALERSSLVKRVTVDRFLKFSQGESITVVGAPQAWSSGPAASPQNEATRVLKRSRRNRCAKKKPETESELYDSQSVSHATPCSSKSAPVTPLVATSQA